MNKFDFNIEQVPMDVMVAVQAMTSQLYAQGTQAQFQQNPQQNQAMTQPEMNQ